MKIILAPDSFKECLTATQVAQAMALAVKEVCPSADVVLLPLADGGEGTLEVLAHALDARLCEATVSDPLGRPVRAQHTEGEVRGLLLLFLLLTPASR